MKSPPFEYLRVGTIAEAISALSGAAEPRLLAGGQSLVPMLNLRYVFPGTLIDINELHELAGIDVQAGRVRIGALTRQRKIEIDPALAAVAPVFAQALRWVGHRQTRNRGTLGGSLCHLDPAAELPNLALLHDATIEVEGPAGTRTLPAGEFIAGFMSPGIGPDEMVTALEFTPWSPRHGAGFQEFARRHGDFAIGSAAVLLEGDGDGTIRRAAICIGGLGSVPQRHPAGEAALTGSRGEAEAIDAALDSCAGLECLADFHAGPAYRLSVARTMLRRSIQSALDAMRHRGGTG
jgi:aerobic carbon-monoxide dehydrogenase medium subunit